MAKISIKGLDKAKVLLCLYNGATSQGEAFKSMPQMAVLASMMPEASIEDAQREMQRHTSGRLYFDYTDLGCGPVPLKVDLTDDEFEASSYDDYHGEGKASALIDSLRNGVVLNRAGSSLQSMLSMFDSLNKGKNDGSSPSSSFGFK